MTVFVMLLVSLNVSSADSKYGCLGEPITLYQNNNKFEKEVTFETWQNPISSACGYSLKRIEIVDEQYKLVDYGDYGSLEKINNRTFKWDLLDGSTADQVRQSFAYILTAECEYVSDMNGIQISQQDSKCIEIRIKPTTDSDAMLNYWNALETVGLHSSEEARQGLLDTVDKYTGGSVSFISGILNIIKDYFKRVLDILRFLIELPLSILETLYKWSFYFWVLLVIAEAVICVASYEKQSAVNTILNFFSFNLVLGFGLVNFIFNTGKTVLSFTFGLILRK